VWREDGVPHNVPLFITEGNISSSASEASVDIFGALWLADYVGAFLTAGGDGLYYFHYIPLGVHPGCNRSDATFGMFSVDDKHRIVQPLSQFFSSQLINTEWLKSGADLHKIYPAQSDIHDSAGRTLVTAYAVQRPDRKWALLVVNKDQENPHKVTINFHNADTGKNASYSGAVTAFTFGPSQYKWNPLRKTAAPDGPALQTNVAAGPNTRFELPAASMVVLRGTTADK